MSDETTPLAGGAGGNRRVAGGRYVLRGLLGQGGMADVELAYDQTLDRQVAVKILHARYAQDEQFLSRFRREAQSAANLNHPNVVAVYDFGDSEGRPYIVMEYVAGRSLKEVMQRETILPERAAEIAGDAALALHYAHERGLVHRDIKPANIMVSDEGTVKVTDFGIARAVNAETVTQTAAVFGTAAYVAPEQAQGEPVDRRTDVYALGCVLYEMLTGQQPFAGDSAVAVAYKHVSEQPIAPSRLNPEIPPALEAVVLRAMAKQPAERYASARDLNADLQRAVQGQPVAAPPAAAAYATTQMLDRPADATLVAPPVEQERVYYTDEPPRRGSRTVGYVILAILILLAFVVGAYLLATLLGGPEANPVQVPDVTNQNIVAAQTILQDAGFRPEPIAEENADVPPDIVFRTDPEALTNAPEGSTVQVFYSSGAPLVVVPRVEGLTVDEATQTLIETELQVGAPIEEPNAALEPGIVIRSEPQEGQEIPQGSPVQLVVSTGPPTFALPDVTNLTEEDATQALTTACQQEPPCVAVQTIPENDAEVPEGRVVSQDPGPDADVNYGDTVTLVISAGPVEVEPPPPPPSPSPSPSPPVLPTPTATEPTPAPTPTDPET